MKTDGLFKILSGEDKAQEKTEEEYTNLPEQSSSKLSIEYLRTQIEKQNEEIEGLKQDRKQRKIFSYCIFGFMCLYMAASIVIVSLCGAGCLILKESILITLLTTTLANVIGVFNFVAKYLFHK